MSEERQKTNWLAALPKIVFFVIAFVLVILTVLANMGGHSDSLKTSVEEFIAQNTGYKARIQTLNNLSFFPTIACDFEGLDMYRGPATGVPLIHADRIRAALSFWDVLFSDGKIKALDVLSLKIMPGVFLDKMITLDSIDIADIGPGKAQLEAKGFIGAKAFYFSLGMGARGEGRARKYFFAPRERPADIKLGDVSMAATLRNGDDQNLKIENLKASLRGQEVFSGDLELSRRTSHEIHVTGTRIMAEHKTLAKINVILDTVTRKITGTIQSDNFNKRDFTAGSRFDQLIQTLIADLTDAPAHKAMLDEFFKAQAITLDVKGADSYTGPLVFENNHVKIP